MKFVRVLKDSKKDLYRYNFSNRKIKQNVSLLLNWTGDLVPGEG